MLKKIINKVYKIRLDSNIYFLDFNKKIIIDAGVRSERQELKNWIDKLVKFEDVQIVILTHLHYDHVSNVDLFPNAKFYASKESIEDFKKNAQGTVLNEQAVEILSKIKLEPLPATIEGLQVVNTPGHTRGSVCLYYEPEQVLFSGDTLFDRGIKGRIDLPTSVPEEQPKSMIKLIDYPFKHLCPGHDY